MNSKAMPGRCSSCPGQTNLACAAALVGDLLANATAVPKRLSAAAPEAVLTARERELLVLLPTRMTNDDIALQLYVSVNTVKTHTRSIYRKLGVPNRRAAVTRAENLGLL
jgi:LuxR family maltose regulon positive regulatory protein